MTHHRHLGIIGSGASAVYLLKHILDRCTELKGRLRDISIFERSGITGMGMPYNPLTTDRYNMANISSREMPPLTVSFAEWLRTQETAVLKELDLGGVEITQDGIYSRLALGQYLKAQYNELIDRLTQAGFQVQEHPFCDIADVQDRPEDGDVLLTTASGERLFCDRVVIATGHYWAGEDDPSKGYYASPWPMGKILPEEGKQYAFTIGTLGASLSAFDVISSLAHRQGKFVRASDGLRFEPHANTGDFRLRMHSAHGLLPHLQFALDNPLRTIYGHADRRAMVDLVARHTFLRLETFFDRICRPALSEAFQKDQMPNMVHRLADPEFTIEDFVEIMTAKHEYVNAFEGMRFELKEARESVHQQRPIHWKEVIDDLIYTLNYHAELLPAEDHLTLRLKIMPFLLNVVAAMPLASGEALLALYDAGKLEMVSGVVSLPSEQHEIGGTTVHVKEGDREVPYTYRMFIDCSGQKPLEMEEFPFPSLVKDGTVRTARVPFFNPSEALPSLSDSQKEQLVQAAGQICYPLGGVDIDGAFRLVGVDGKANPRIHDIAFSHTSGVRPYSYGLQACSDTAAILVEQWTREPGAGKRIHENSKTPPRHSVVEHSL